MNTEPHVQQLVIGPYLERDMGPQGLASVWFSVYMIHSLAPKGWFFCLSTQKNMQKVCSKCGETTNYDDDLHCREILRIKAKQLLLCGEIKEAKCLVAQAQFNEEWKRKMIQDLFLEPKIREEIQKFRQQQHLIISRAQNQFIELANKYNVDINEVVDESGPTQLAQILVKLDKGENLDESEEKWLEENKLFELLANHYHRLSKKFPSNSGWCLARASAYFRDASLPEKAIEITNEFSERLTIDIRADSAVYTSRGAAFRSLHDIHEAKECANEAIRIRSDNFYSYCLLGGIAYDEGDAENGSGYFEKAIELGANPRIQEMEIKNITDAENRQTIINYLLKKDPKKYAWVKQFQP